MPAAMQCCGNTIGNSNAFWNTLMTDHRTEYLKNHKIWIDGEGTAWPLNQMTLKHLYNCADYMDRYGHPERAKVFRDEIRSRAIPVGGGQHVAPTPELRWLEIWEPGPEPESPEEVNHGITLRKLQQKRLVDGREEWIDVPVVTLPVIGMDEFGQTLDDEIPF